MNNAPKKIIYKNMNLDCADFCGLCLIGVRFENCSIRRANFSHSDLSYTKFIKCDLYETNFEGSTLYFCNIESSDATKSNFSTVLLNGIRIKDTNITHAEFGMEFEAGKNRKWQSNPPDDQNFLVAPTNTKIPKPIVIEHLYSGIKNPDTKIVIRFLDDPLDQRWRRWRRKAELAKTVEKVLYENGYKDKSLDIYYLSRYYLTRSEPSTCKRLFKILFLEAIWGYGVKVWRPALSAFFISALFAMIYAAIPLLDGSSGLVASDLVISPFGGEGLDWAAMGEVLAFSIQVSSLSVYSNLHPTGFAKGIALVHTVSSVVVVGLAVATITRRLSNV